MKLLTSIDLQSNQITNLAAGVASTDGANVGNITAVLSTYAPLASPSLTGTPTTPTAISTATGKQVASLDFAIAVAKAVGNGSVGALQSVLANGNTTTNTLQLTGNLQLAPAVSTPAVMRLYESGTTGFIDNISTDSAGVATLLPMELKSKNVSLLADRNIFIKKTSGVDVVGDVVYSNFVTATTPDYSNTLFGAYVLTKASTVSTAADIQPSSSGVVFTNTAGTSINWMNSPNPTFMTEVVMEMNFTLSAIFASVNGTLAAGITAQIGFSFGSNLSTLFNTNNGVFTVGGTNASSATVPAQGDNLTMRLSRFGNTFHGVLYNLTKKVQSSATYVLPSTSSYNWVYNLVTGPGIFTTGGTFTVSNFMYGSPLKRNPYLVLAGDNTGDQSFGGQDDVNNVYTDNFNSFANILNSSLVGNRALVNLSAVGQTLANYLTFLPDILRLNPKYLMVQVGYFDAVAGVSASSFTTYLQAVIAAGYTYGFIPIFITPMPAPQNDSNAGLIQNYAQAVIALGPDNMFVDIWSPLNVSGTNYRTATYNASGSSSYTNQAGHNLIATTILAKLKTYGLAVSGTKIRQGLEVFINGATVPTLSAGDNSISVSSTKYVSNAIAAQALIYPTIDQVLSAGSSTTRVPTFGGLVSTGTINSKGTLISTHYLSTAAQTGAFTYTVTSADQAILVYSDAGTLATAVTTLLPSPGANIGMVVYISRAYDQNNANNGLAYISCATSLVTEVPPGQTITKAVGVVNETITLGTWHNPGSKLLYAAVNAGGLACWILLSSN